MVARTRKRGSLVEPSASLVLRSAGGKPICEFSGETVSNMRRMLTSLMYQATMPKSIANVAALREEGVTHITLAMATTLASDVSASVCALELNWWHPSLHLYIAGQPPVPAGDKKYRSGSSTGVVTRLLPPEEIGIGAVLRGTTSLSQGLVPTSLPNLSLLPAGHVPPEARSALARSAQLQSVISTLLEQFDYLIFDMPAVAVTSDTVALTALSASVCMVVRQGVTPVNKVKAALDEVKHVAVLGVILNRVEIHTPGWIVNLLPQE